MTKATKTTKWTITFTDNSKRTIEIGDEVKVENVVIVGHSIDGKVVRSFKKGR